ncbi:MAG: DUF547 domain-containing protein [Cyclobacteriaceae bacterium]
MKRTLPFFYLTVLLGSSGFAQEYDFFKNADAFFKAYVIEGKVNYQSISDNSEHLTELIQFIENADISSKAPSYQLAFLLNTYNLLVIKGVLNNYPMKSPLDKPGFFKMDQYRVMGKYITLDQLEFDEIFKRFPDPRIHFMLNCAATSCPTLYSQVIAPEDLSGQLEYSTIMVIDREDYIHVDHSIKEVRVSKIFEWYRDIFDKQGGVIEFINKYRFSSVPEDYTVTFMEYDWSLNEFESGLASQ